METIKRKKVIVLYKKSILKRVVWGRQPCMNKGVPSSKAKYEISSDSEE